MCSQLILDILRAASDETDLLINVIWIGFVYFAQTLESPQCNSFSTYVLSPTLSPLFAFLHLVLS